MQYKHVVDATRLAPIWFNLAVTARDCFCPTLEYACQSTARHLSLTPPVITHGVADMVREVRFATRDYASLTAVLSAFLFVPHTAVADEKLRAEARIWYNDLRGNICPSMAESSQILDIDILL